jgi:hypothetical protein
VENILPHNFDAAGAKAVVIAITCVVAPGI